ncbi:MAG: SOS response-associated peptidase [Candidatus Zixiibacteriota bacterium]
MCGRYVLAQDYEALKKRYGFSGATFPSFEFTPRYNISPGQLSAAITNSEGARIQSMKWGLIPHWAKDPSIGYKLINARSETVAEKPSFRDAFRKRRCLVPASGFYEWQKLPGSKAKQPFYITCSDRANADVFSFAGLWSVWDDPDSNNIFTYTILTTGSNELMNRIHNRMPVILRKDDESEWLDNKTDLASLKQLFEPFPYEQMNAYPVSTMVNSPKNDLPACISPL